MHSKKSGILKFVSFRAAHQTSKRKRTGDCGEYCGSANLRMFKYQSSRFVVGFYVAVYSPNDWPISRKQLSAPQGSREIVVELAWNVKFLVAGTLV